MLLPIPRKRGIKLNRRPKLLWIDLTVSVRHAELSAVFTEACEIRVCPELSQLDETVRQGGFNGVCFDVDYPDQYSLDLLRKTKARYPSLPVLLLTLQHSESLAVWAFRTGVIDFLVKPVSRTELHRSLQILNKVSDFQATQESRMLVDNLAPIPAEIPITMRKDDIRLLPAIYFVKRNFRYKVRNEVVAELCEMSPFRFSRSFRETYGITFQDYVIRYRILEGCRILRNPNINVTDVAYAVGFNDASYFARTFKRYIGTAPSAYCSEFRTASTPPPDTAVMRALLKLPQETAANDSA